MLQVPSMAGEERVACKFNTSVHYKKEHMLLASMASVSVFLSTLSCFCTFAHWRSHCWAGGCQQRLHFLEVALCNKTKGDC